MRQMHSGVRSVCIQMSSLPPSSTMTSCLLPMLLFLPCLYGVHSQCCHENELVDAGSESPFNLRGIVRGKRLTGRGGVGKEIGGNFFYFFIF